MPPEVQLEWYLEEDRHIRAFTQFIHKWPNFRLSVAYALLGSAIATVDMMGGDAEEFLSTLRQRCAKPTPLIPPAAS